MSVSLTVRLVFGYRIPDDVLDYDEHPAGFTVDPVDCMGGSGGDVLFATTSAREVLRDRDGYVFEEGLIDLAALGDTTPYLPALYAGVVSMPEALRPRVPPRWLLHINVG